MLTPSCFWNACAKRLTRAEWRSSKSTDGVARSAAQRYTGNAAAHVNRHEKEGALPSHFDPPCRVQALEKPPWAAALSTPPFSQGVWQLAACEHLCSGSLQAAPDFTVNSAASRLAICELSPPSSSASYLEAGSGGFRARVKSACKAVGTFGFDRGSVCSSSSSPGVSCGPLCPFSAWAVAGCQCEHVLIPGRKLLCRCGAVLCTPTTTAIP